MSNASNLTIARVIARLNVGGPAIQAIQMTRVFRERGYRTLLLAGQVPSGERSMEFLARANGVEPIRISTMSRRVSPLNDLLSLYRLIWMFRRERPEIVHTHTAKAGTLGRLAAMIAGVPVRVHTFHGHVFSGYFSPPVTRVFIAIERFLARHTDRIIAISESQRRELVETYRIAPAEKVVTVNLGFDLKPLLAVQGHDGELRSTLRCDPKSPLIGWVGRLTAIKQPELLVETAVVVHQSCPAARFVVVGDGESRNALQKRIVDAGLCRVVELLGCRQDMPRVYADLDVLLLTSRNEGTPVAMLEAMASGKPFIATDVGGVRDLAVGRCRKQDGFEIFDNGILAPPDSAVLSRAVEFLASNPDLCERMGAAGRALVVRRFSYIRLADDLERLYRDLARAKAVIPSSQAPAVLRR